MARLHLSTRERDIIRLGARGLSDKGIGAELGLSDNTVKAYFAKLRTRIGRFDRAMLPGIGLLLGIVSIAEITRGALEFLQRRVPDVKMLIEVEHEGAD